MSDIGAAVRATHYARPAVSVRRDDTMSTAFLDAFYTDPFNVLVAQSRVQCADMPEIFSPNEEYLGDETDHDRAERITWAKAICRTCPIIAECRAQAIARNEPSGIWGGLSERGRRSAREGTSRLSEAERTHCPNGHEYNEANTRIKRDPDGKFLQRDCRPCANDRNAAYRARIKSGDVARDRKAREAVA